MILTIFNSGKHLFSNVSALKGAFFKEPTQLNIQVGFIIDPFQTQNMKIQTENSTVTYAHTGKLINHRE